MSHKTIYLDHNATTPLDPLVLEAMLPFFTENFANPASPHSPGQLAHRAIHEARSQVAALINAHPQEITFTSSATEANNLALVGLLRPYLAKKRRPHIITQATEHPSVLEPCLELQRLGVSLTILPVNHNGQISRANLEAAIRPETILVSIMTANHELGTLQPITEIGKLCRQHNILFHTDGSQAIAKIPLDVQSSNIDLLTLSAHKFHGPKGAAALYLRAQSPPLHIYPLQFGGPQERNLRPGTLNVPAIVGLGKAAQLAQLRLSTEPALLAKLRHHLEHSLQKKFPDLTINAAHAPRLPHVTSLTIPNIESESLLNALTDLALSSGSACSSSRRQPSSTLLAIGLSEAAANATLRISLGRTNTREEIDQALHQLATTITRLRSLCSESSL